MPDTKLTLRLDAGAIARAKRVARARGTSVSALVEGYFAALDAPPESHLSRDGSTAEARPSLPPMTAWFASLPPASPVEEAAYERYRDEKYG